MSERGAEGILRRQAEAAKAAGPPEQPAPRPSRVKSAAAGAAGGSVGGAPGAAAGAVAGLLTGGGGKRSGGNKALVAEFSICMLILLLSPLTHQGGDVTVSKFMKKGSATAAVFIILGFISSAGGSARKVAAGIGLLMTLTILLNERSVFGELVKAVNGDGVSIPKPAGGAGGDSDSDPDSGAFGDPTGGSLQERLEFGGGYAGDAGRATNRWLRDLFGQAPPSDGSQVLGGTPGQTTLPGMGGV